MPITPLDLYVVERTGHLIDRWMLTGLLEDYGKEIGPLPSLVLDLTHSLGNSFAPSGKHSARLLSPLGPEQEARIRSLLKEHANERIQSAFESALKQVSALASLCRCTHPKAVFHPNTDHGFFIKCTHCKTTWSLTAANGGQRFFALLPKDADADDSDNFAHYGRDCIRISIPA